MGPTQLELEAILDDVDLELDREVMRARDVRKKVGWRAFERLRKAGRSVRVARGLYVDPLCTNEHIDVIAALTRVPHAFACLETAAWMHGMIDDEPEAIWLAIDRKARRPHVPELPYRFVRASGPLARVGLVEPWHFEPPMRVTGTVRTIVDALRYRRHLLPGTAVEWLRSPAGQGADRAELLALARAFRVRPAMERALAEV